MEIVFDPKRGYYGIATKEIQPGGLIFEEVAFAAVLDEKHKGSRCAQCFASNAMLRCSGCKKQLYCNRNCQKLDWNLHKMECKAFLSTEKNLNVPIRFLMRLLYAAYAHPELAKGLSDPVDTHRGQYEGLGSLKSNYNDFSEQKLDDFEILARGMDLIMEKEHSRTLMDRIILLCKSSCNSMTISEPEYPIGAGLFINLSKLNHSCVPNTVIVMSGTKASLRALQPIKQGEELYFSYIQPNVKKNRQQELLSRYFFDCMCEWCQSSMEPTELLKCPQCHGRVSFHNWKCMDCAQTLDYSTRVKIHDWLEDLDSTSIEEQTLEVLDSLVQFASEYLYPSHAMVFALLTNATSKAIECQIWEVAMNYSIRLQDTLRLLLGPHSLALGVQLYITCTLAERLNNTDVFGTYIREAARLLRLFHPSHEITLDATIRASDLPETVKWEVR
jgi:SET and MYND domain-containing protein